MGSSGHFKEAQLEEFVVGESDFKAEIVRIQDRNKDLENLIASTEIFKCPPCGGSKVPPRIPIFIII
jgi:hypothetical protein